MSIAALEARMMLTGTAPTIDSLTFSNPYVSSGSVSGDFAGVLSDSTPGAYYTIEIDTNGDQMPDASGMTGSPGSFSTYGSMPLATTSVQARAVEMDSTTWQYVYGNWQTFAVTTGVVVNTPPTISSLTFANPLAAYGSLTGEFVGSVTDATPSYSYNIEVDTNGDEVSEFSFGAYSNSFNQSHWLPLHVTSVNARAVEYDSALGESVSGGWQAFGIDNGVVANTLPTVDGLTFSGSYAAFGFATGFFTGSVSDATPSSSSYTIEMYTDMNPVSAIVGSSSAGSFNLSASILVGTTSVTARAKEFVYATGQTVIGDWQSFPISDGVVANTMPTISLLEFTNSAASWFSKTGLFVGALTDATPGSSYSIEIEAGSNHLLYASAYLTSPGSFSVDGTIPVGTSSVRARAIETISATNQLAYGDWEDFSLSGSGSGSGSGTGSSSSSYSPSFVENLVVSLLAGNPNPTVADVENALFAYIDSLNLGASVQSVIAWIANNSPTTSSAPAPAPTPTPTPTPTSFTSPAPTSTATTLPATPPPATTAPAVRAASGPITTSLLEDPSDGVDEIYPSTLPFIRPIPDEVNRTYFQVEKQMVWDGQATGTFETSLGQAIQGRFLYVEQVRTFKDSRNDNKFTYTNPDVLAAVRVKYDAESAALPRLKDTADALELVADRLTELGFVLGASALKYEILAILSSTLLATGAGAGVPLALQILAAGHAVATLVIGAAAYFKDGQSDIASGVVMAAEARIADLVTQLTTGKDRTGKDLPRLNGVYYTDIKHRVSPWITTSFNREFRWEDCTPVPSPSQTVMNLGIIQDQRSIIDKAEFWVNLKDQYERYVTE